MNREPKIEFRNTVNVMDRVIDEQRTLVPQAVFITITTDRNAGPLGWSKAILSRSMNKR